KVKVRGTVVDDAGRPVAGATVSCSAVMAIGQINSDVMIPDQTADGQGVFSVDIRNAVPGTGVLLRARAGDAFTAAAVRIGGDVLDRPVTLTVSPRHARALTVRALDDEGRSIAGAAVVARHRRLATVLDAIGIGKPVEEGGLAWVTGRDGRFESPRRLDPDGQYRLEIRAAGLIPEQTGWKAAGEAGVAFGDVVLKRTRPLEGRVLDRQSRPVGGAKVTYADGRQRVETVTDADGRFKLDAASFPPGFVFVDKAGFRFHGQRHDRPAAVAVTLVRRDEPADRPMTTLPAALSRAERKALAGRLLEPMLKVALAKEKIDDRLRPLELLARLDPGRLLEELERRPIKDDWYDAYLRRGAARALLAESPDEARTVVDSMRDPGFRSRGYLDLCDALPADKRAEKIAFLNQALLHAQRVEANDHRILSVAEVARRLWALGEKDRAAKLLRDGEAVAKELPTAAWPGYARGAFAEDLALIDRPAALALLKDLKDPREYVRHHANLAHKLAGTDPAEAERVFARLRESTDRNQQYQVDQYVARVCYRMTPIDLPRARRIAEAVGEGHTAGLGGPIDKARAYGAMAQALAKSNPKEARDLLDRAFAILAEFAATGKDRFNGLYHGAAIAGVMVPTAEAIDPGLVPEFLWRTVALRPRQAATEADPQGGMEYASVGAVALVVARYDHALAMALVEEAARYPASQSSGRHNAVLAAAIADPRRAVALVEALPEGPPKDRAREAVAGMLLADGDRAWRAVHRAVAQWYIDDEDFGE
ncbi:MAG TPA: hypothetical protein VGF55_08780, partial [Gemmataceae bacterium]